ncbi:MAG: hypothetical protein KAQ98_14595 [Bacteriovoracaceae bacterium]|nr:hypothetical protein [Bacteriovoracaceae bacterium]
MGKEPKHVERVKVRRIIVNHCLINEIHIDLEHVNYGVSKKTGKLNTKRRSNFKANDVVEFVKRLDRNSYTQADDVDGYLYYEVLLPIWEEKREYRLVFCVEKTKPNIICVVTLYCIGRMKD